MRTQVRIGSLGDPDDLPGLAHFTEHMLFYASEKYPLEDEYSKFVVSFSYPVSCGLFGCVLSNRHLLMLNLCMKCAALPHSFLLHCI